MAKATQANAAAEEEGPQPGTQEYYQALLEDLNKKGGEPEFAFLQKGKNRIRLLPEFAKAPYFYKTVMRSWQGAEPKPKYIIKALVFTDKETRPAVKGMVLPKTVIVGIAGLLAEGFDLFTEHGNALTILKEGEGLQTTYNVMASPRPVPMPTTYDPLELTLDELVELRLERDAELAKRPISQTVGSSETNLADLKEDW